MFVICYGFVGGSNIKWTVKERNYSEQRCHDPGLTGSHPDPSSSDLTLIDEMGQGFVGNFHIRHFVTARNLSDAVATLSKIIQCTNRDKSHVI